MARCCSDAHITMHFPQGRSSNLQHNMYFKGDKTNLFVRFATTRGPRVVNIKTAAAEQLRSNAYALVYLSTSTMLKDALMSNRYVYHVLRTDTCTPHLMVGLRVTCRSTRPLRLAFAFVTVGLLIAYLRTLAARCAHANRILCVLCVCTSRVVQRWTSLFPRGIQGTGRCAHETHTSVSSILWSEIWITKEQVKPPPDSAQRYCKPCRTDLTLIFSDF
jgi:hypothetical protein